MDSISLRVCDPYNYVNVLSSDLLWVGADYYPLLFFCHALAEAPGKYFST